MEHRPDREVNPFDPFEGLTVIDAMTRSEMLANGDLIAVPPALAHMTGFKAPVAITRAAWLELVHDPDADTQVPDDLNRPLTTHEMLHLRKVCHAATFATARAPKRDIKSRDLRFTVSGQYLWLDVGHDDDGEVCFTIMQQEDR